MSYKNLLEAKDIIEYRSDLIDFQCPQTEHNIQIAEWGNRAKPGDKKDFEAKLNYNTGYGIKNGVKGISYNNEAKIVLIKTDENTIEILTSYPKG